ncbi:domain-containing 3 [Micractinium conductrix]|uniref:Domain-containing 3 n=1 Tax=Micractinium conductrix TaxID=554055 RepID=A0A2P6VH74_9CHLO|nr:domain-containing 3 [Micractinium conductrix]|eukprot:PSC73435.1 domain-containing 3 [Micractinium conductrix]
MLQSSVYHQSAGLAPSPLAGAPSGCRAQRRPLLVAAAANASRSNTSSSQQEQPRTARRELLAAALLVPAAAALLPVARAAADELSVAAPAAAAPSAGPTVYTDADDKFSIAVPAGWEQGVGAIGSEGTLTSAQARFSNAAGMRRVVAFVPEGKPDVSVAVTIQFLAADFTKMGSLGSAYDFASGVVNRMDNSYILNLPEWRRANQPPVQIARLVDAKDAGNKYNFTYTVEKEGEPARTVWQSVAIGWTGRYNRLFTVNATCTSPDAAKYGPVLEAQPAPWPPVDFD